VSDFTNLTIGQKPSCVTLEGRITAGRDLKCVEGDSVTAYPVERWTEIFAGPDGEEDLTLIIT
jgi:hypothetical protein